MKIKSINMYQLKVPFADISYRMKQNVTVSEIEDTIVEVITDEGIIGWGEICPWGRTYLPEFAEGARAGIAVLADSLIGVDPLDLYQINTIMDNVLNGHAYAKSAVDMACWDILGKFSNLPLHVLLGGRAVPSVNLLSAVFPGLLGDMMERIDGFRERGYRYFSTKPSGEPQHDIDLYHRLAKERRVGEIFVADANCSWSLVAALQVAVAIEDLGFLIEQPCKSYNACLSVRRRTNMPMILDELVVDADVLDRVAQDKAADIVHIKLSRVGGITKARILRDYCVTAGLTVSWATSGGTEIADSAAAHIACSTPESHLFAMWTCREFNRDRFAEGGPELVNGTAIPTQLPGLGVSPDRARLGKPVATFQ